MSQKLTLDQRRAEYAWKKVNEAAAKDDIVKYTNLAKAVPSLVMNSGLMQTIAFLKAKKDAIHDLLLSDLTKWLGMKFMNVAENNSSPRFEDVMQRLYRSNSSDYMQATTETMALLRWIRQFADACKSMKEEGK